MISNLYSFMFSCRGICCPLALCVLLVPVSLGAESDERVAAILAQAIEKHGVPAMGGMVVGPDGPIAIGVAGVRKAGTEVAVTIDDKWHLGSNTKAMTATVIGKLVDEGKLRWDSTLQEVFPEAEDMHEGFRPVTVAQILTHRGGLMANLPWGIMPRSGSMAEVRREAIALALTMEPTHTPGEQAVYSNTGYVVLGTIIEQVTGEEWAAVMRRELFEPLGMTSVGFGGLGTEGEIDQPWPHVDKDTPASTNGAGMDNPPVMGPAGTVHCKLADYGKFLAEHLRGERGEGAVLSAGTAQWLHTPPFGDEYAAGWVVVERPWARGRALTHAGSNTLNYTVVWMAPEKDRAVVVTLNVGGREASRVADEVAGFLIEEYLVKE